MTRSVSEQLAAEVEAKIAAGEDPLGDNDPVDEVESEAEDQGEQGAAIGLPGRPHQPRAVRMAVLHQADQGVGERQKRGEPHDQAAQPAAGLQQVALPTPGDDDHRVQGKQRAEHIARHP